MSAFDASLNPYRGCEHGCIYCYARPTHEYLGFSAGLDFETRIMVKEDAPKLLRDELSSPRWVPEVIAMSGVTDCYQPIERRLKLTRGCLEVLAEFRNPVTIVTKNNLVTRDLDLLSELARSQAVAVFISLTTLDTELRKILEPRTSPPAARLATIRALAAAGVPVGALVAPVIPGLTDHEIPALVAAAAEAGAQFARLCDPAPALRRSAAVRGMADEASAGEEGEDPEPHPRHARRQAQRLRVRPAHARRGYLCRADRAPVRRRLPQGRP